MPKYIISKDNAAILKVWIQPGSKRNEIVGEYQERLKIKIASPPVDGKANTEVIFFLSKVLSISKNKILLIKGQKSRQKDFLINLSICELRERMTKS